MKSILEEIWYCNIDPQMDATRDNKEVKNLLSLAVQNRDKLSEKLNDEEKEILEKYGDCINEMNSIIEREIFRYAVSLHRCYNWCFSTDDNVIANDTRFKKCEERLLSLD